MQGDCPHIKSAHKHRRILIVRRMHAAPLVPRGQESAAAHRGNHLAVLFVHAGDIAFSGEAQPVGIHGLGGALDARLEHVLQLLAGTV